MEFNKQKIKDNPNFINTSKIITTNSYSDWIFENTFLIFKSFYLYKFNKIYSPDIYLLILIN